jgi:glycosyltransferase involved in cell wall biosynthesis
MTPFRILTWHVHGSYLDSLARTGHELYLAVADPPRPGAAGRWPEWGPNVVEVAEDQVRDLDVDVVLFQSRAGWEEDQERILSAAQRRGPRIYLEHDPPREHPTDTRHWVQDPDVLLVQVTHFNDLMWDAGPTPTRVIEHAVHVPDGVAWTGELERGIVVINDLATRGRRLGRDIFERAREVVPLDLAGMRSEALGGLGDIRRSDLTAFEARYRFFFHPIRYTSLGLAMIEAMTIGMPVVAVAATEVPTVLEDGVSGILATDVDRLIDGMGELLRDPVLAAQLGRGGQRVARERFSMERFARDWTDAFAEVTGRRAGRRPMAIAGEPVR